MDTGKKQPYSSRIMEQSGTFTHVHTHSIAHSSVYDNFSNRHTAAGSLHTGSTCRLITDFLTREERFHLTMCIWLMCRHFVVQHVCALYCQCSSPVFFFFLTDAVTVYLSAHRTLLCKVQFCRVVRCSLVCDGWFPVTFV